MKTNTCLTTFILCLIPFVVSAQLQTTLERQTDKIAMNRWVDSVFHSLNEEERIGQLFMVIVGLTPDSRNTQKLNEYIHNQKIGGILFHQGDPITQADMTNSLQELSRIPLFVALDGEWGLSMRLSGTTRFPKNMLLGATENLSLIEAYGKEVGRQCRRMGIHMNFAPLVDINSNPNNPIIGLRAFGECPEAVSKRGIAYARGLESEGIIAVVKHFPGHGDTSGDSHHTLPIVNHSRKMLDSVELWPFRKYVNEGFSGVMTGHVYVPALERRLNTPASLSRPAISGVLRDELGFSGLCITDALVMKGAIANGKSVAVEALLAGNDIALAPKSLSKEIEAVKTAIQNGILQKEDIDAKCKKVLRYKYIVGLNKYKPLDSENLLSELNSSHADWIAAQLNSDAITVLKNESNYLPIKKTDKKKVAILSIGHPFGNEFSEIANRYGQIDCYKILRWSQESDIQETINKLNGYDIILCLIYTQRIKEHAALIRLAAEKEFVHVFFTLPYHCPTYRQSIEKANAVVMAYEGTPLAQECAAQVVFGGIGASGHLPVTVPGLYERGEGIHTEKNP